MTERQDFLRECNEHGVALPDFQAQFCDRCQQPECHRSQYGKSRFDQRVMTWEERLIKNPARMNPNDPRYASITAKQFITLDVGRTPEVRSAWIDPQEAAVSPPAPVEPPPPPAEASSPPAALAPPTPPPARTPQPLNTPAQKAVLLSTPGQSVLQPSKDAWDVPLPPKDPVVQPGAKVKVRGSGV